MQVRQSAGLLLKNNFKEQYATTAEEYRQYIKVCFPQGVLIGFAYIQPFYRMVLAFDGGFLLAKQLSLVPHEQAWVS